MSAAPVEGFIERLERAPTGSGPLDGLSFGLKDLYDVAGRVTGCGNPDWRRTHAPAPSDCSVLARLLDAGARLTGITHTDELAYSLNGENAHYGTPVNPAAQGRIPGGSSSGSASVTAAGLVDFAIGSDTGGSVRIPATYCGLYGIRTTFGAIPLDRCMPLAPSFDTCGWFARDAEIFTRVGAVLLDQPVTPSRPRRLVADPALFAMCDAATRETLQRAVEALDMPVETVDIGFDPERFKEAFRILQAREIRDVHGAWVTAVQPRFGPGVVDRFRMAAAITDAEVAEMQPVRDSLRQRLNHLLDDGTVLVLPTAPGPAPVMNWDPALLDAFRYRIIALTCLAGHAGLPQVSIPAGLSDGAPVGLSLMGGAGTDAGLLGAARAFAA
ncbi:MAG: amidase [Minwuia sp.]|nr:amidase [Minwuia sp.]